MLLVSFLEFRRTSRPRLQHGAASPCGCVLECGGLTPLFICVSFAFRTIASGGTEAPTHINHQSPLINTYTASSRLVTA